ncbi:zinc transporter 11-like [Humulus lupulus]|uniref:zinc transporter 11-like n=1 Tax=Humulus lupulus TaxID=3486 RepID=UPI002B41631A|nr:zinc transporter 11-like [Humulus lupulus]
MPRSATLLLLSLLLILLTTTALAHSGHHDDDGGGGDDDHDSTEDSKGSLDLRSRPLILVKVWCLILIFVGTFLAGLSPYFLKWNEGFLVLGTQFAGGVFLGTALMHFLSDANETFEDLTEKKYPFAFMLACFGYLLTMLADCVVSHVFSNQNDHRDDSKEYQQQGSVEHGTKNNHHTNPATSVASVDSIGDSVLLIVALCFHSIFEGIAIGVAETKSDAWKALWTISLHKIFAAIAMGIALLRMIPNRPLLSCAAYAFAFAISSPVGVGIGIIIDATTQGNVADWIFAISMGLACGVFIYVSINHLLAKGYTPHKPVGVDKSHLKFLAVLLGVGVIAVVMIWDT